MPGSEQQNCVSNKSTPIVQQHRSSRIRRLNDNFRRSFQGGRVVITTGVQALGPVLLQEVLLTVQHYDQFAPGNDPYEEHDFGAFSLGRQRLCWKIDYYDPSMQLGSGDPSNRVETARVLTIMLVSEY